MRLPPLAAVGAEGYGGGAALHFLVIKQKLLQKNSLWLFTNMSQYGTIQNGHGKVRLHADVCRHGAFFVFQAAPALPCQKPGWCCLFFSLLRCKKTAHRPSAVLRPLTRLFYLVQQFTWGFCIPFILADFAQIGAERVSPGLPFSMGFPPLPSPTNNRGAHVNALIPPQPFSSFNILSLYQCSTCC